MTLQHLYLTLELSVTFLSHGHIQIV
ncbi:hypothetical protein J2W35_006437 [Variovorax boronicumulans]|nr:hypothetical protein [Variovorax boronicumulans]